MTEQEQGSKVTWKEYNEWRASLTPEQRRMGRTHGQWPEGTPQVFTGLEKRITAEERLLNSILGGPPLSIEEMLTRPDNYLEIKAEESRRRAEAHGGRLIKEQVEEVLNYLTNRERRVIHLRFGLLDGRSRTQAEVGQEIGSSRWTAGRIERKALDKLRHPSNPHTPKIF